jgi:hypothetical protein
MKLPAFKYALPSTLAEAVALFAASGYIAIVEAVVDARAAYRSTAAAKQEAGRKAQA